RRMRATTSHPCRARTQRQDILSESRSTGGRRYMGAARLAHNQIAVHNTFHSDLLLTADQTVQFLHGKHAHFRPWNAEARERRTGVRTLGHVVDAYDRDILWNA